MDIQIKKVYFDMDGVLVDFDKALMNFCGLSKKDIFKKEFDYSKFKVKSNNPIRAIMETYMDDGLFLHAPEMEEFSKFVDVMNWLTSNQIEVEILSSVTGEYFADVAIEQKKLWLSSRKLNYKQNYTKGSKHKVHYANAGFLLIDDFDQNINQFIEAGGQAIHHYNIDNTLKNLKQYFPAMNLSSDFKKDIKKRAMAI